MNTSENTRMWKATQLRLTQFDIKLSVVKCCGKNKEDMEIDREVVIR